MTDFYKLQLSRWIALILMAVPTAGNAADRFDDPLKVQGEEELTDPILAAHYTPALQACQKKAKITSDHATCYAAEFKRQDQILNHTWSHVFTHIGGPDHVRLLTAQRQWLAARDPFCLKNADQYAGGTIVPIVYENCRIELTIRRGIWLERFR